MNYKVIRGKFKTFINAKFDNMTVDEVTLIEMVLRSKIKDYEQKIEECKEDEAFYQERIEPINALLQKIKKAETVYIDACYHEGDGIPPYDVLLKKHQKMSEDDF